MSDVALAGRLAEAAGAALLEVRNGPLEGRELKDAGDRRAQEVLAALLRQHRPDDAVLSEEAADSAARLSADRVWIIDPLDGTREFSERPRTDWAVHVALWSRTARKSSPAQGDLVAGAVALPALGLTYLSDPASTVPALSTTGIATPGNTAPGATAPGVNPATAVLAGTSQGAESVSAVHVAVGLRLAVSRSRPPSFVLEVASRLGAELVPMGSAGVKAASVWRGEADAYVHGGGQYEWDSAAPVAVARAAGLFTSRIDGSPLEYNRPDPLLPDLVVCRPEVASDVLKAIAEVTS